MDELAGACRSGEMAASQRWLDGVIETVWAGLCLEQFQDPDLQLVVARAFREGGAVAAPTNRSRSGRTVAMVAGEACGAKSLSEASGAKVRERGVISAGSVAEAYEDRGIFAFASMTGSFAAVVVDLARKELLFFADRWGSRPVYYGLVSRGLVFASKLATVRGFPGMNGDVSLEGVAEMLTFGQLIGDRTLSEDIRLVPASSVVRYEAGAGCVRIERYAEWPTGEEISDKAQAIEMIDESLHSAVRRSLQGGGSRAIGLSAGFDARVIMAVAQHLGEPYRCATCGLPGAIELRLTHRMCQAAGVDHVVSYFREDLVQDLSEKIIRVVEIADGESDLMGIMDVYLANQYGDELGIEHIIRGHGGELMKLSQAYNMAVPLQLAVGRDHSAASALLFHKLSWNAAHVDFEALAVSEAREVFTSGPRESLQAKYNRLNTETTVGQCSAQLFIEQYLARYLMPSLRCYRTRVGVANPLLDTKVIETVLSSPISLRVGTELHRTLIARNCPPLMKIPNSDTRAPLTAGPTRTYMTHFVFRALHRLGFGEQNVPELWIQRRLSSLFNAVLVSDSYDGRDIVNAEYVRSLVARYQAGKTVLHSVLSRLACLEFWFQKNVDRSVLAGTKDS